MLYEDKNPYSRSPMDGSEMDAQGTIKPMAENVSLDSLKNLICQIETIRPAYSAILRLFGPIFLAQEKARESVVVHQRNVTTARLESFKLQEKTLIDKSDFIIDMKSAKLLFGHICAIAVKSDAKELHPETALMLAVMAKDFYPAPLFRAVTNEDDGFFRTRARAYQTAPETLMLMGYNSIKPSLESCASGLKNYLSEEQFWQKPGCPVCGSTPVLSVLDTDGKRFLICGFCWSQWAVPRIRCPFCLVTAIRKLHYKVNDHEKEYRIEACDRCRSYLKTVDTREIDRHFYAPLETIVSAHLDLLMENDHIA